MGKERMDERASAHIRICNQMCSYTSSSANSNSNSSSSNKKLTSMYSDPLCHSNRNMSICVVMSRHHRSRCIMHTLHHIFHIRSSNLRCCLIVLTSIRCVVVFFFLLNSFAVYDFIAFTTNSTPSRFNSTRLSRIHSLIVQ